MWRPYYFINLDSEKRVIDSDKRYIENYNNIEQNSKKISSEDGFRAGIPMEVVEIEPEPEINIEEMLEQARLEAQQIISEAKAHADALRYDAIQQAKKAYDEQTQAGYSAGLAKGKAQADSELKALKKKLYDEAEQKTKALEAEYEKKKNTMESEIIDAIITVFHKVFHIQFEEKKEILLHLVNDIVMNVDTGKSFRIRVSSKNRKFFETHIPEIKEKIGNDISIEIVNDMELTDESCMIETDSGVFNCGVDMQLSNLEKDIRSLCI